MAEAISIPSQLEFKELLSHTFPGLFSALSLFMLIDYFSEYDLTAWAIGTFNGLIAFVGLILVVGTILGVIFDGIHHSFIEDDIFDNFEYVNSIKSPLEMRLKEQCSFGDKLTRRFYFKNLGDKGDKAISIDDHLDKGYYRYSEFYSNIFISLILFSVVAPLYIFEVLQIPWRASIIIGIVSLIAACICLICSYTSYKQYLRAQLSVICSYTGKDEKCNLCSKDINNENPHSLIRIFLMFIFFSIPILIIKIFYGVLPANHIWYLLLIFMVVLIFEDILVFKKLYKTKFVQPLKFENESYLGIKKKLSLVRDSQKEIFALDLLFKKYNFLKSNMSTLKKLEDFKNSFKIGLTWEDVSRSASGSLVAFLSSLFVCMIALTFSFIPISANIEPANISFIENITDDQSIIEPAESLIFKNSGRNLSNVNFTVIGIDDSWIEVTGNDVEKENNSSNYTIKKVPTMSKIFLVMKLKSKNIVASNSSSGSYAGAIDFHYRDEKRWILNENNSLDFPEKEIPIYIKLTKKPSPTHTLEAVSTLPAS